MEHRLTRKVASALEACAESPYELEALRGDGPLDERHRFLLLVKPELLDIRAGVKVTDVLNGLFFHLQRAEIAIGGARLLPSEWVMASHLVRRIYPRLSSVARAGRRGFAECHQRRLAQLVADSRSPGACVLGGFEFLTLNPEFTPASLCALSDNVGVVKLGSGVYALKLNVSGTDVVVLNAFFPFQEAWLTRAGRWLLALECFSHFPWSHLRSHVIGSVHPHSAAAGSFRRWLSEYGFELGMKPCVAFNGLHISPGPLEAQYQLSVTFEKPLAAILDGSAIGRKLSAQTSRILSEWATLIEEEPDMETPHGRCPLFELTEDSDVEPALEVLASRATGAELRGMRRASANG